MGAKIQQREITSVVRENCTFTFYVETRKKHKIVTVRQFTDFSGTSLEQDFPNGCWAGWQVNTSLDYTDTQAVNMVGAKWLKEWTRI